MHNHMSMTTNAAAGRTSSERTHRHGLGRKWGGRGFTLIEILIVVIILGILSAIVTPQFAGASEAAHNTNLRSQLWRLRGHIEYYNARYPGDRFDPLTQGWDQLIDGGFLDHAPTNPMQDGASGIDGAPVEGNGWVWADLGSGEDLYGVNAAGGLLLDPDTGEPM